MAWNIDADIKKVGANLKRIRISREIAIDTVATAIKLSPQLLQQLEDGLYPDCKLYIIFDLIAYYGVPAEEVFGKSAK